MLSLLSTSERKHDFQFEYAIFGFENRLAAVGIGNSYDAARSVTMTLVVRQENAVFYCNLSGVVIFH